MKKEDFKADDWKSFFAGKWSLLSASFWGRVYTGKGFTKFSEYFTHDSLVVIEQGVGLVGYFRASQIQDFAEGLAHKVSEDISIAPEICDGLKERARYILSFIDKNIGQDIPIETFKEYERAVDDYYRWHIMNKYAPEGIPADKLEEYLPLFEEARLAAEPVFMRTEEFMNGLAKIHSEKIDLKPELILCMIDEEFYAYLETETTPEKALLEERLQLSAMLSHEGEDMFVSGKEAIEVKHYTESESKSVLKGATAHPGKVEGIARIVHDPANPGEFNEGDILVAKSTRPDYLPLMSKAVAFVTDAGGVLSHAAIVAREMKKPCVIGTQLATKEIEPGSTIEVDADAGEVRVVR